MLISKTHTRRREDPAGVTLPRLAGLSHIAYVPPMPELHGTLPAPGFTGKPPEFPADHRRWRAHCQGLLVGERFPSEMPKKRSHPAPERWQNEPTMQPLVSGIRPKGTSCGG